MNVKIKLAAVIGSSLFSLVAACSAWAGEAGLRSADSPRWKILVLIYPSTDHRFSDAGGEHHVVARKIGRAHV